MVAGSVATIGGSVIDAGDGHRLRSSLQLLGVNVSDPGLTVAAARTTRHGHGHVARGLAVQLHRVGVRLLRAERLGYRYRASLRNRSASAASYRHRYLHVCRNIPFVVLYR